MSTLIASSMRYSFYPVVLVKFYCDVMIEAIYAYQHFDRYLLLVNFVPFLRTKEEGRSVMVKRKLDGAVDESSVYRKIRKWDAIVHNL